MMLRSMTLFVCLALCGALAWAADPVGLVVMANGKVQILRAGQKAPVPARTADLLTAGDRLLVGPNSEASFLYCPESRAAKIPAGGDVLFGPATVRVLKGKLGDERKVPACRLPANLALSAASQQQSGMTRLRGVNLLLRTPSHTNIVDLRPFFRWSAVDGAKLYDVRLMDREERVLWRQSTSATELRYSAEARPLEWGQKYWWRVTARDGEDTVTESGSFFQVLTAEQAEQVRSAERGLRAILDSNPADNGPRFLLAFLYEESGMLDQAARTYGELADRMGPQDWVQARLADLLKKLGWDKVDTGR